MEMRRIVTMMAAVGLVAALGFTSGHADGPMFGNAVRVGTGISEPGIHVAPNGIVYVDGPAGLGTHSKLWRSTNGGASYEAVNFGTGMNRMPGGGDSDVATRGSRVYYLDLWAGSNSLSISEDNGETWVVGQPFTSLPLSDRQWIALGTQDPVTGLDTVYVLYALIQEPRQVMLARSRTGGLTWDFHAPVPGVLSASGFTGQLASDGKKFLTFAWEDRGVLRVATSEDEGVTWATSEVSSRVLSIIPSIALDGEDIHVAWIDRNDYSVNTRSSRDKGTTWGAPHELSAPGTTNIFTWIDARNGKVSLAWYGVDTTSPVQPDYVEANSRWMVRYAESTDRGATWSNVVDVALGKTGIICTRGLNCDLPGGTGGRELGDFLSVVIDNDGKAMIAFGGRISSGVRVAKQL